MVRKHPFMRIFIVLLFVATAVGACDEEQLQTLSGKWKLAHFYNAETGTSTPSLTPADGNLVLTFSDDGRMGTITRDSLRGPLVGLYEIGPHKRFNVVSVDNPINPEAWNAALFSRISNADFVKISSNTLNISCNQGREILLFVREN